MVEMLGALLVVGALIANNLLTRHDRSRAEILAPQAEP
jgi:hypothetical protein